MSSNFRQYLPSANNPHPRFDLSHAHEETPYSWVERTNGVPSIAVMRKIWSDNLAEPYVGFTSNGTLQPNLYKLDPAFPVDTSNMIEAAKRLLESSSEVERKAFVHSIDAIEWRVWANPELYINRFGIRLEESTVGFQEDVLRLLEASLSEEGYRKAVGCMRVNEFLGQLVNAPGVMNFYSYNFNMFGAPSATDPWGFNIYGHHLAMNVFILGSQVVISPTFMGGEPDNIDEGPFAGLRLFDKEESDGLALMQSLSPELQSRAQVFQRMEGAHLPKERYNLFDERHVAGAFQDNRVVPYEGILATELTPVQQDLLLKVVEHFIAYLPAPALEAKLSSIREHLADTHFSWYGGFGESDVFYYRIHSPVVIVEFDHHKGVWLTNSVPVKAHIHTCVRTPNGNDYGKELLRLWKLSKISFINGNVTTRSKWTRLVRFVAVEDGLEHFGDLKADEKQLVPPYHGLQAQELLGDPLHDYNITSKVLTIARLLSPIPESSIPLIRMVGLNYAKHLLESNKPLPTSPCLFISAPACANGPFSDVPIPVAAQGALLDYEGEMVIVIGKKGRNIPREEALSHIAGFSVGNDVSARQWQRENGTQWCFSKGFDKWAPFGPWLQSRETMNLSENSLTVFVNNEPTPRQSSPLDDMIFKPADVVAFFSQGTTLEVGTVIFTGTPHGVGFAMNPPGYLKNGDVVKVAIKPTLGEIANKMAFESDGPPVLYSSWA